MYSSRLDHETAYDLYQRGRRLLADGHPHGAATVLTRAKLIEPEKASIRESLGRALFMSGRHRAARREFAKAVQLNPSDDFAHYALARACERTGEPIRALAHAKLAIALHPGVEEYERLLRRLSG